VTRFQLRQRSHGSPRGQSIGAGYSGALLRWSRASPKRRGLAQTRSWSGGVTTRGALAAGVKQAPSAAAAAAHECIRRSEVDGAHDPLGDEEVVAAEPPVGAHALCAFVRRRVPSWPRSVVVAPDDVPTAAAPASDGCSSPRKEEPSRLGSPVLIVVDPGSRNRLLADDCAMSLRSGRPVRLRVAAARAPAASRGIRAPCAVARAPAPVERRSEVMRRRRSAHSRSTTPTREPGLWIESGHA
jgi:hypothetical protein